MIERYFGVAEADTLNPLRNYQFSAVSYQLFRSEKLEMR